MAKFIIIHGQVLQNRATFGVGDEIELEPAAAKHMDPNGSQLATPEEYAKLKEAAEAEAAYAAQLAEKDAELGEERAKAPPPPTAKQKAAIVAAEKKKTEALEDATAPAHGNGKRRRGVQAEE